MGFSPNGFTAGPVLTSEWEAEFTLVRNWLNTGIVVGDITDNTLDYTHICRPDTYGFPKQSHEGETQVLYESVHGAPESHPSNAERTVVDGNPLAEIRQRVSIFPDFVDVRFTVWPTCRRIVLDETSDVDITCTWYAVVRMDLDASSPSQHPNSGGDFVLSYTNASTGSRTVLNHSLRTLTTAITSTTHEITVGNHTYSTCGSIEDLTGGVYDIALEYVYDDSVDKADIYQVIIVPVSIVIEVHKS